MDSFHMSSLLSENHTGECSVAVIVRRHIFRYVDEQNWRRVLPAWFEAEVDI